MKGEMAELGFPRVHYVQSKEGSKLRDPLLDQLWLRSPSLNSPTLGRLAPVCPACTPLSVSLRLSPLSLSFCLSNDCLCISDFLRILVW